MNRAARKKVLVILSMNDEANRKKLAGIFDYTRSNAKWEITIAEPDTIDKGTHLSRLHGVILGSRIRSPASIPTVALYRPEKINRRWSYVFCDNAKVGECAADFFIRTGFSSFAYINAPSLPQWSKNRGNAFHAALPPDAPCRIWPDEEHADLSSWLKSLPRQTAVLAAEDAVARDAMLMCDAQGIEIPRDLAFLGVDNDELLCESTPTPLTSIEPHFRNSGYMTAKILDEMMSGRCKLPAIEQYGVSRIIKRGSAILAERHNRDRLNKALSLIRTRCQEKIGVADIAAAAGMSRRSAELMFRKELNQSIGDMIRIARLDLMMEKLKGSGFTISEICAASGFSSESYAKRAFKARFGKAMGAFRKHAKTEVPSS